MSFHNRWPTAASRVRAGFLVVWLQLSVSGFRLVLARSWHGGHVGLTSRQGAQETSLHTTQRVLPCKRQVSGSIPLTGSM
jgi:hypothetical protein